MAKWIYLSYFYRARYVATLSVLQDHVAIQFLGAEVIAEYNLRIGVVSSSFVIAISMVCALDTVLYKRQT